MKNKNQLPFLHNHTEYSNIRLLDSINKVSNLMDRAYGLGSNGVAITDHEVLSAHVQAIEHLKEMELDREFKLILGNEIYLIDNVDAMKQLYEDGGKAMFYHFILLAKNKRGHEALRLLSSEAWINSFVTRGPMTRVPTEKAHLVEIMKKYKGDIIGSTACLGGEFPQAILNYYRSEGSLESKQWIDNFMTFCIEVFGKEDFFVEVQPSAQDDQNIFNKLAYQIANAYGVKVIVTTDSHYLTKEDREVHKAYLNSKQGDREVDDFYSTTYMMDVDEIIEYLQFSLEDDQIEDIINNTIKISDMCENYDLFHKQVVPSINIREKLKLNEIENKMLQDKKFRESIIYAVDNYSNIEAYVNSKDEQEMYFGIRNLYGLYEKDLWSDSYLKRIDTEIGEIIGAGINMDENLSQYYNTMEYIMNLVWADDGGNSLVGPGRGSVNGFLTAYLMDITQIDSIKHELPHWRHLSAERPEIPDIDFDTEASKRSRILRIIKEKLGYKKILNIATFGTEKSKSAMLTACRGLKIDIDTAEYLSSLIPVERGFNWSLKECFFGDEEKERKPLEKIIKEVERYPRLKEVALGIEGLINKRSSHASGVYIFSSDFTDWNAMMRAPSGLPVTQFNMADSDYLGGLKYDFLTVKAMDKIRVTLELLSQDGYIEWKNSLKETYEFYLHPDKLIYDNREMWKLMHENKVLDLFQYCTSVGLQAAMKIRPFSLKEGAIGNNLMRLMAEQGKEQPIDKYVRFKADINLWYRVMDSYGLTKDEMKIMLEHLGENYGVADTQEVIMEIVMDKRISGFNVVQANKLRKAVAKKKKVLMDKVKELFKEKGLELGTSINLLKYIWKECILPQAGYSFSKNHTLPYTVIAVAQLNLAFLYPAVYWNTACLSVNAGSLEDSEALKPKPTDYGAIASAISKMKENGIVLVYPDINRANFDFSPDAETDSILFGLKSMNGIGQDLVAEIIENRPYESMWDFYDKVKVNKTQIISLIKGGSFDELEQKPREEILEDYLRYASAPKLKLTMQNANALIDGGFIPDEFAKEKRVFKFNKYLRRRGNKYLIGENKVEYYLFDDTIKEGYYNIFEFPEAFVEEIEGALYVSKKLWDKVYQPIMAPIKAFIKKNHNQMLIDYNNSLFNELWEKYASGTISHWEMESICYYHHEHELIGMDNESYGVIEFNNLPTEPTIVRYYRIKGIDRPIYKLDTIAGTVLDKDKQRHTVTILTTNGIAVVKMYRDQFAAFDKQISERIPGSNKKKIVERSWFKRGNKLLITGFRRETQFVAKTYKNSGRHTIYKITDIHEDGSISLIWERNNGES